MWKRFLLALALFAALFLVACGEDQNVTPTAEPEQAFVAYENEELGLALEHPESWVTHTGFSGLTVASDQMVIDSESLDQIGDEAFVNIIPGELAVFGAQTGETFRADQPEAVLQKYKSLLENEGQVYTVIEPTTVSTVDGENVAWMVVSSPVEAETLVTMLGVVINDEFMALISAGALEGQFEAVQPTLEQIVSSIVVTPPSGLEGETTGSPLTQ